MNDINDTINLLEKATSILNLRSRQPKKPGEDFNVFTVLQLNEVGHCRLLYELLDPNGSHGMGDIFLRRFFELVLVDVPYRTGVAVYREYAFWNGRIDLLIKGTDCCYPIEVKICAGDQQAQIARYDEFAAKEAEEYQVYYLTLNGAPPSEQSRRDTNVTCLSFAVNIRGWLVRCGEEAWRYPAIAEIIRQYIKRLDEMTGNVREDIYMKQIRDEISKSQANYESAVAIANSLPLIRAEMMERVFEKIEERMEGKLIKINSDYKDITVKYYKPYSGASSGALLPGLAYRLAKNNGKIVALRFEVDKWLFWGISFYNGKESIECPQDKLAELLTAPFPTTNWRNKEPEKPYWLWREYLPAEENMRLNFKECNGAYPQLYDEKGFNNIMQRIFDQIDEHLEHIIETGLY